MNKHKVVKFQIISKDEKSEIVCDLFLVPGSTPRMIMGGLGCPDYVVINPLKPRVFRPDENLFEAIESGGALSAVPVHWPDAAWWAEFQGAGDGKGNRNSGLKSIPKAIWERIVKGGRMLWERISSSGLRKAASSGASRFL